MESESTPLTCIYACDMYAYMHACMHAYMYACMCVWHCVCKLKGPIQVQALQKAAKYAKRPPVPRSDPYTVSTQPPPHPSPPLSLACSLYLSLSTCTAGHASLSPEADISPHTHRHTLSLCGCASVPSSPQSALSHAFSLRLRVCRTQHPILRRRCGRAAQGIGVLASAPEDDASPSSEAFFLSFCPWLCCASPGTREIGTRRPRSSVPQY